MLSIELDRKRMTAEQFPAELEKTRKTRQEIEAGTYNPVQMPVVIPEPNLSQSELEQRRQEAYDKSKWIHERNQQHRKNILDNMR